MKVLLLRADATSPNLGVRVLKEGTEALVRQAWGPSTVVHVQNFDGGDTGRKFNRQAIMRDIGRSRGPIKSTLNEYDVVIDVCGGDSFTDIYGMKRLALILYTQRASQKLGIPTVMGPQTIGPFDRKIARWGAARSMQRMKLVISRDTTSEAEAASLGRPVEVNGTDVVFALPTPEPRRRDGIVINASGLLWNENSHVDHERYRRETRKLILALQELGRRVIVLPHVLQNDRSDNDVPVAEELAAAFPGTELAVPTSLSNVREILSGAELTIGARMHACLNSISVGTPAVPWAYSRKFAPLMADIGWNHVIDIRTNEDPSDMTLGIIDEHSLVGLREQAEGVRSATHVRLQQVVTALAGLDVSRG